MKTTRMISLSFLTTLIALAIFKIIPLVIPILYVIMSGVTYLAYFKDKASAQSGQWRIPENTLHILSFCFGWPGALVAQQTLRHKTQKEPFRQLFWLTIILNMVSLLAIIWLTY